jgi:biopolymer transport protein ExbB/TolQ
MGALSAIQNAFQHGGIWMYVILIVQVLCLAIIVERAITLYMKRKADQKALAATFEKDIRRGDLDSVIEAAEKMNSPLSRVVLAGAKAAKHFGGQNEIQGKMDEVLLEENQIIEKRTGFLAMLGNAAMLTGLLGTITGMIRSFSAVSSANPTEKATLLSAGISEAMNCCAYGLIVAIPALVFYAILQNRQTALSEDLNQGALRVFNWLSYSLESVPAKAAPRSSRRESEAVIN